MTIDPRTAARNALRRATLVAVPVLLATTVPWTAYAQGAPVDPVSRAAACGTTGARQTSAACVAAVAANGGVAFDAWDRVRVAGVQGRDRERIPDGRLCSAGLEAYRGLDIAHTEWPTTELTAGGRFTLEYRATVRRPGTFDLYLTKEGYDPAKALRWADLASEPFATVKDPALKDGSYRIEGTLPGELTGAHVLYTVWRNDGAEGSEGASETYYSCSDVVLTGEVPESGNFGLHGKQTAGAKDTSSASADAEPSAAAREGGNGGGVSFTMVAGGVVALALLVVGALATLRPPSRETAHAHDGRGRLPDREQGPEQGYQQGYQQEPGYGYGYGYAPEQGQDQAYGYGPDHQGYGYGPEQGGPEQGHPYRR
ncbi:hypothetical protein GCM10010387_20610 [Streptomyces inusitatus]|uniref:Chitin-binding type-4 domain-containing protein n=1 Tax=Streptomyces inusitatus TaxID=68221 RepID=A0A918UQT7_9ACTN|nr:lytic polysaccharide monooxygenase [Streptomyces inusitatus]GGZ27128.1 hypothetical protein GCM10010387_20610 [Streptomyces inusitatus]